MATSRISEVIQHLRRAVLLQEGADLTDGQLLEDFISRSDEAAFAALVRRHGPMVWGVCRRLLRNYHDAEDAFQATFLVLVRKAASVLPRGRVANWLYGVAHQTALKARATVARREQRERQVATMPEPAGREPDFWCDLQPLLDQELSRLPAKYRAVLVLCDLEGKTRKEAARQLRVPEGTVAGRLARARTLLARRLARHGLVVAGGALAAVVSQQAAAACVPSSLMASTIKAASTFAAGKAAATGVISVKVAVLTQGVLKAMALSKLKTATVGLLLVALLSGAAGAIYQTRAAEQPKGEQGNKTRTDVSPSQEVRPPKAADLREYVLLSRLVEAGADQPKEVLRLPKVTVEDGQPCDLGIVDGSQNLLAKVGRDEKIKIGTFFNVRVRRLEGNKVRLFFSFQRNEVEKSSDREIRVLGNTVQAIQEVELHKPVKMVFQKDARGSAQRWVEITVDEQTRVDDAQPPAQRADAIRRYGLDPTSPLASRVKGTPSTAIKMFEEAAGAAPTAHALTEAERRKLAAAFAALPPLHRRVLGERLRGVSFLDGMPNTALTSTVNPDEPYRLFDITIRAAILRQDVSEWLTQKERTCFKAAGSPLRLAVEAGKLDAIVCVLLHEATHVVDSCLGITPAIRSGHQPAGGVSASAFTAGVWSGRSTPSPCYRDPLLERVRFRAGGQTLAIDQAESVYAALRRTPFVSLYGSSNWYDDLAEYVTLYHLTEVLGQPYRIVIRKEGKEVFAYEPMKSEIVRGRVSQMKRFYEDGR